MEFSGFAIYLSRSFHVMAAKREHSSPPIWTNTALVNLPSAVRRAASDRDEETIGLGFAWSGVNVTGSGAGAAGTGFFKASGVATGINVAAASLSSGLVRFFFATFRDRLAVFERFIVCSLHGTVSKHTLIEREVNRKAVGFS
jgi:uncharacterized membrane protein YdfJ with MMPL/SSD domain